MYFLSIFRDAKKISLPLLTLIIFIDKFTVYFESKSVLECVVFYFSRTYRHQDMSFYFSFVVGGVFTSS